MKTLHLKKKTPGTYRGNSIQSQDMQSFMAEWSTTQAEANHVETIEEANDFEIYEEEDDFFQPTLTVYEMQEAAEDNLLLLEEEQRRIAEAESNETGPQGDPTPNPDHAQSAPVEPNSPLETPSISPLSSQHTPTQQINIGQQAPLSIPTTE